MIILNRDHDEPFLRSYVGRIGDEEGLIPLWVISIEDRGTKYARVLWEHVTELCPAGLYKHLGFDCVGVRDVECLAYL